MKIVHRRVKEKFGTKAAFCEKLGVGRKNFVQTERSVKKSMERVNSFLAPLGLVLKIVKIKTTKTKDN